MKNKQSWHKVANLIYIDNPAGTGFSHYKTSKLVDNQLRSNWELSQETITNHLIEFLNQFLKLLPHYIHSEKTQLYIFGESYGGTYVIDLAETIIKRKLSKVILLFHFTFTAFK